MKCSTCEYESDKSFSICPCCGNKNISLVNINEMSSNESIFLDKKQNDKLNSYTSKEIQKEIQFENIKIPFNFNKDFIQKNSDSFIINAISGGDFFPNKEIEKIIITISSCLLLGTSILNRTLPEEQRILMAFYFIFLGILAYVWSILTNIKTKFNFSFKGINISSKKGSLFIPKEDIKDIYIHSQETINKGKTHTTYSIFFEFNQPIYIPYPKTNKIKVNFLNNFYSFVDQPGKLLSYYIVQEIKKALDIK